MKGLVFYLVLPFFYGISLLPFPLFYLLSDFFYILLYYVVGFRKKIVRQNLKNSFPEKSDQERLQIEKKFYRFLCDLILEMFKLLTISKEELMKRCPFDEASVLLFKKLNDEKKSCIVVLGHHGNWEWVGCSYSIMNEQQLYAIYHPLTNKYFDQFMYGFRTRFGTKLYAMNDTIREMLKNKNEINVTAFIADQAPSPKMAHWTSFLDQDTPVFYGPEKMAKKMNLPVVFVSVRRVKRGYYIASTELLVEDPQSLKDGEITERHVRKLEQDIRNQPETWLWSHRRWKHKR